MIFIFKLVAITLVIDCYLYWVHRAFHSEYFPNWFRNFHAHHHVQFQNTQVFTLGVGEFLVDLIGVGGAAWFFVGLWFVPFTVGWGLFEAARGHGHFTWFKLIPRSFYKACGYCGMKYHLHHHKLGHEHENMGQMLKVWDKIMGTEAIYVRNN